MKQNCNNLLIKEKVTEYILKKRHSNIANSDVIVFLNSLYTYLLTTF